MPVARATQATLLTAKSSSRNKTVMAVAISVLLGLASSNALALSLGRISVLSALGEPLRAEVDIPSINAEEAATLKASVAMPEAFRAAGLEYNSVMSGLQLSLQRKPDGRAYIRIISDRSINEPYVDLILEANWATGRIVRDYTMLFDPPSLRQAAQSAPSATQISPARSPAAVAPAPSSPAPAMVRPPTAAAPAPMPAAAPRPSTPAATAKNAAPAKERNQQVSVKRGDTAGGIALATKSGTVSLDQMLVAMLRANPDAFIEDNINRLKAGVVLNLPSAEQAQATSETEASQIIQAQSRDFDEYRRKLASAAPVSQTEAPQRKASGSIQTQVEEKKPAATSADKLTLSKGAVQGKTVEDQIAKTRGADDAASRAAELAKNVSELSKLGAAATAPAASPTAMESKPDTPAPAITAPAITAPTPEPAPVATTEVPAPTPASATPAPAKPPVPVPTPAPNEPGLLDEVLDNPMLPAAAAGLIALLAGLGFYRSRQRKQSAMADSSFMESRLQPDSFFNASGGQQVDTNDGPNTGSSMVYSPSQLDAADDVDPVAEADVYLAYGRDLQAEEILKEALRAHPSRIAIHLKLLEIYSHRRDLVAFENIAREAYTLTGGTGADWERVCELGQELDPGNALYQPGGQPGELASPQTVASASDSPDTFPNAVTQAPVTQAPAELQPEPEPEKPAVDLDLDLDFSLDDEPTEVVKPGVTPEAAMEAFELDLDLALDNEEHTDVPAAPVQPQNSVADELPDLSLTPDGLSLADGSLPQEPTIQTPPPPADNSMMEFDLSALSLELNTPADDTAGPDTTTDPEDPLATKLALAQEFSAIGDSDGARALIEEVIAEATGELKAKAQDALKKLA